jgi:hypothetical protein
MLYETTRKWLVAALILLAAAAPRAVAEADSGELRFLRDDSRKRLYVLLRSGLEIRNLASRQRIAHVPLPGWIAVDEAFSCSPDIALAPEGDILVTSNVLPIIWRINHRTLLTTKHEPNRDRDTDKDVGFISLHWSAQAGAFVATTPLGSTWHIDRALSKASWKDGGSSARPCLATPPFP